MEYKTEQEAFWAGEFGNDYIVRNDTDRLIAGNISLFSKILSKTRNVKTIIEFGANIGLNLRAIQNLIPFSELSAIEINGNAINTLKSLKGIKTYHTSILNFTPDYQRDFVFIKTVLIHINPDMLPLVYDLLYQSTQKYICIAEYYNPTPVTVNYRGHTERLFKRDFAGEMLDRFKDLKLIDYGFTYRRDNTFDYDDINWFLLEK